MKASRKASIARVLSPGAAADALIYAGCAALTLGVRSVASIPLQREWGLLAVGPYFGGAVLAGLLALRRAGLRSRVALAVAVFAGAAVLPMALEATWRSHTAPGLHAQSEVIVTEEAAKVIVHGQDPYAATYLHGPLAARPLGTKTHFPYLPAMLLFGLPRALDGGGPLTDGRIWFAAATLVAFAVALLAWRAPPERKLRAFQLFLVLPTGALLMATGGDDLPVVALMLLSLILLKERRPVLGSLTAGAAAGLAAATKQTAWLFLPFLVMAAWQSRGRRAEVALAASAVAVAAPIVLPFVAWNAGAFVEDAVRFPLGLGRQASAASTPTLGRLLVRAFPTAKGPFTAVLVGIILLAVVALLIWRSPRNVAQASLRAGLAFTVALALAPAARLGYVVYPLNLLAWSWLLMDRQEQSNPGERRPAFAGFGSPTAPGYSGEK